MKHNKNKSQHIQPMSVSIQIKLTFLLSFLILQTSAQELKQTIVQKDITHYWQAVDAIKSTKDSALHLKLIQSHYIQKATNGLLGLIKERRYTDKEFVQQIIAYPKYWESIKNYIKHIPMFNMEMEEFIKTLKKLYPSLQPATIYYSVGAFRSGGTYSGMDVLLGAEFLLAGKDAHIDELPDRLQNIIRTYSPYDVPLIAIHEYVHTQQKRGWENYNILKRCVAEGVAEFISTLVTQRPFGKQVAFGKKNQDIVLNKFMEDIFNFNNVWNWMWNKNENELGEDDLGYYIGYEICERFYQQSSDKKAAIKTLIELDYSNDSAFAVLVDGTGFLPMTVEQITTKYNSLLPKVVSIKEFTNGSKNVSAALKTVTIEFSEVMDNCCRSFDEGPLGSNHALKIESVIGWSEDNKSFSFNIKALKPGKKYQLVISNFAKESDGNRLSPYLIEFTTAP